MEKPDKQLIEYAQYHIQQRREEIIVIKKRIEQASDDKAELRQLILEAGKDTNRRFDLFCYMLMNYNGAEGIKKIGDLLALYIDDNEEKNRRNAAHSLMNLTDFKLKNEIETINEIEENLAIDIALETNVHSSRIIELALRKIKSEASLTTTQPEEKSIKAFDHNYSEEELKQLYRQYAYKKVTTTEKDFVDILMGESNKKINWTGKPADLYRFIRYFCKEVVPPSSCSTIDQIYEVRKHKNRSNMEEVPFKNKEMTTVFLVNGNKPTIHKTKTIYMKDLHDTFKEINGL